MVLDLKWIRKEPEAFRAGLEKRQLGHTCQEIENLDSAWRDAVQKAQTLQSQKNALTQKIAALKRTGEDADLTSLVQESAQLQRDLSGAEAESAQTKQQLDALLNRIPNIPADTAPLGKDESDNVCIKTWGEKPVFTHPPQSHDELGKSLGQIDFEAAARLSGSRFVVLKGDLARLERALGQFMLDLHTQEFGYTEIAPPYLVREAAVYGVGQLPKFAEDLFATTDGRWLISTAETALTNLVQRQTLEESLLPLRYTAYTPCFRSEAGAAGKDTRGMVRLHQFHKVELVHITTPEAAAAEYAHMCATAESILQRLELPYRVMALCTGDMGFAARQTLDLEVWLPAQEAYREISSCSDCGDFQARRMGARYRSPSSKDLSYVYTLNGSALPTGRTLVALLENYQQPDGSILIPEALRGYMGGQEKIEKN